MEYKGKLYGKVGGILIPLSNSTDDWDAMEKQIKELKAENEALKQANGVSTGDGQLTKPAVIKSVCSCGRREINVLSGICDICWNEKFPDEQTVL